MKGNGLILYHHNSSVCAAKVRVALARKGLDFQSRLMRLDGDQFDPAYLALNPAAVVPTLVHDGRAVIESNVILEYLEDAFPAPSLRPADPHDLARARLWMMRLDGDRGIHHAASVLTYAIAYRHYLIDEAGGTEAAGLSARIDAKMNRKSRAWLEDAVFQGVRAPAVGGALARFDELLADFEAELPNTGWLAGGGFSIAEAAYLPYMIRLDLLQLHRLWRNRPCVAEWYARLKKCASAAAVLDWYDPMNIDTLTRRGREAADDIAAIMRGLK